jgi:hypothetical protein
VEVVCISARAQTFTFAYGDLSMRWKECRAMSVFAASESTNSGAWTLMEGNIPEQEHA